MIITHRGILIEAPGEQEKLKGPLGGHLSEVIGWTHLQWGDWVKAFTSLLILFFKMENGFKIFSGIISHICGAKFSE